MQGVHGHQFIQNYLIVYYKIDTVYILNPVLIEKDDKRVRNRLEELLNSEFLTKIDIATFGAIVVVVIFEIVMDTG
ncbi:MAG: hypothetical protein SCALA701_22640 [Candidatus Scalindua sp.]|nr:MAG: hypothetical protein SCALA701_22640 [Candidatus Scalindua sp.]